MRGGDRKDPSLDPGVVSRGKVEKIVISGFGELDRHI
jgi:hypothetical protein